MYFQANTGSKYGQMSLLFPEIMLSVRTINPEIQYKVVNSMVVVVTYPDLLRKNVIMYLNILKGDIFVSIIQHDENNLDHINNVL